MTPRKLQSPRQSDEHGCTSPRPDLEEGMPSEARYSSPPHAINGCVTPVSAGGRQSQQRPSLVRRALERSPAAPGPHPDTPLKSSRSTWAVHTVTSCLVWMLVSMLLIVLNKRLMRDLSFSYPFALSGMGMAFSSVASYVVCRVLRLVEATKTVSPHFYATRIMPIGCLMALTLHLGNFAYLYMGVAYIQMLKAFTPIITLAVLVAANMQTMSQQLMLALALITVGTLIASYGEATFSWIGFSAMMLSEVAEAVRLVMTQSLLQGLSFHPVEGLMYLAPATCAWLLLGSALFEASHMSAHGAASIVAQHPLLFLLAAALGFCVNTLAYVVISLTSSLTLKVMATAKNAALVAVCALFLREAVALSQTFGYLVALVGFGMYQMAVMPKPQPPHGSQN